MQIIWITAMADIYLKYLHAQSCRHGGLNCRHDNPKNCKNNRHRVKQVMNHIAKRKMDINFPIEKELY